MNQLWNEMASRAQIALTTEQHASLSRFIELLLAANQRMNLTRIADRESAELQHIADALTVLPYLPPGPISLADVGSGSGVPGIPLAIVRPDVQVLLIESTQKKAAFLKETVEALVLSNVKVFTGRAEDAGRESGLRETFDVAVARAVGTMNWLAEWCLPLVKRGGVMLAMKGPKVAEELPAAEHVIRLLGGDPPDIHPAGLPGAGQHVIVSVRKCGRTRAVYPRASTATRGEPL
jgi:16S rRNA (guanine527-N7)-methyltransferase